MTDSMIERVAKAIHLAIPGRTDEIVSYTPYTMLLARAAIEAMREPTQDILSAGIRTGVDIGFGVGYPEYKDLYRAFIEAALKGEG